MLRIAICDDNTDFLLHVSNMINLWESKPVNTVCITFNNGADLASAHIKSPFDIILLDIVMPFVNGIDTAREIRKQDKNVKIIFLTSSPEYAVESYTVKADNYLLKPLNTQTLYNCLDELAAEMSLKSNTIAIRAQRSVYKIPVDNIEYVEAQNKHILFVLNDGTTVATTEPLHVHEPKLTLEDGFFKCHRSYIVNINYINTYSLKEITMRCGYRIPIARRYHKEFESAYFTAMFSKSGEKND